MSNAPRPAKSVKKFLLNLKMDKIFVKTIFTSGEAALRSLEKNIYGKKFFHLGPKKDDELFKGFEKNFNLEELGIQIQQKVYQLVKIPISIGFAKTKALTKCQKIKMKKT